MSDMATLEQAYKDRKAEWVKKRDDFEKQVKDEGAHALDTFPALAALDRGGSYRDNGYFYIKGKDARRKVYDKPLPVLGQNLIKAKKGAQQGKTGDAAHAKLYLYEGKTPRGDYNFIASGYIPYENEAHHLLPVEAVPTGFKGKLELLGKLPYNINHGENIIFLPEKWADTKIHALPQHRGSHPAYNSLVQTDLAKLATRLTAKEKKDCKPEDPPPIALLKDLIAHEEKYWKFLVGRGAMTVNRRAEAAAKKKKSGV